MMAQCLRFVIAGEQDDVKAIDFLKRAAKEAADAEIDIDWFNIEDFERDPPKYTDDSVIVCESFDGEVFDLLRSHGSRIVGPGCVLSCLRSMQPLPSISEPCLSVAMQNVVACCTNITSENRDKLKALVVCMGGIIIGDFTQSVTHLIAGEVGSRKYQVACDIGKPIVAPSWVYDCWDQSRYKLVDVTTDSLTKKHACPCFKGLTICVTGLSADVRQEVKKLTEENGGKYSGELKMRTCTHLIVKLAKGEKYNYAKQWKIHCVSPQWFYECVSSGHWVDESNFEVMPGEESMMDDSRILDIGKTRVNMTLQSDMDGTLVSNKAAKVAEKSIRNRENAKSTEEKLEKDTGTVKDNIKRVKIIPFDLAKLKLPDTQFTSNMLLDGCKIYLSGMPTDLTNQLRQLINTAGAMRFNQLNSNITHIILGDNVPKEVQEYLDETVHKPFVVSPDWLVESCNAVKVLNEKDFSLLEEDDLLPEIINPFKIPAAKKSTESKKKEKIQSLHLDDELEDDDVFLGQYLPQAESSRISVDNKEIVPDTKEEGERISEELQKPDSAEAIAGPEETMGKSIYDDKSPSKIVEKCKFFVKFFEEETTDQIKSLIQEYKGKIVNQESRSDYVLVPLTYEKKRRIGKKEVTICWLEQSLEKGKLLDVKSCFFYQPFHLPADCLPLKDCVMSVSQFSGIEREHLIQMADLLGAVMQDNFVRVAGNGLQANTHLLLAEASGAKYEAAGKWGVACVSKEWLFACAAKKTLVPVEDYPLEEHSKEELDDNEDHLENHLEIKEHKTPSKKVDDYKEQAQNVNSTSKNVDDTKKPSNEFTKPDERGTDVRSSTKPVPKVKPVLQIEKPFKPTFDLDDMKEYLKSPASCFTPRSKSRMSNGSFALDEFVSDQLCKALEITGGGSSKSTDNSRNKNKTRYTAKEEDEDNVKNTLSKDVESNDEKSAAVDEVNTDKKREVAKDEKENGVLAGVVLAVSKKLNIRQTEIHNLATVLGAESQFGFDERCTHLIHKGKVSDVLTEVKQARSVGAHIVSEHWLEACLENNARVQENLYPSTYNPKMSLAVVTKGKRSTRMSKSTSSDTKRNGKGETVAKGEALNKTEDTRDAKSDEPQEKSPEKTPSKKQEEEDIGEFSKEQLAFMKRIVSPPSEEKASSLDARLEFKRQMEELMEATKGGLRRNRRQQLASASNEDEQGLKRSSVARRLRSRQSSQKSNSESSKSSGEKKQGSKGACFQTIEPSQGDVITYDDPAGRLERERILAQLKAASPSQDSAQEFRPVEVSDFPVDQIEEIEGNNDEAAPDDSPPNNISSPDQKSVVTKRVFEADFDHLTTPPKRPVNMHISKPVAPPQPINLLEENDQEECDQTPQLKVYKFLLSAMTPQEKIHYSAMIEELGGIICDAQYFTLECTHVIVGTPNRNEKFFASLAAGKWVLHKSYLEASREAGFFVSEAEHEWGTEAEPSKLTMAAQRWRKKLEKDRQTNQVVGAFTGWNVLLCVGSSVRQHGFKRMLEAGNGVVGSIHPPFSCIDGVTHAFVDPNKVKPGLIDYQALQTAGIWVLRPDYIADYLTQDPPPPARKYVIPEVQKLMESEANLSALNDSKKRKNVEERSSQKIKRVKK